MGEVVNLRRARKRARRSEADSRAGENRIRHGLSKSERQRVETETARSARQLDGAKRTDRPEVGADGDGET